MSAGVDVVSSIPAMAVAASGRWGARPAVVDGAVELSFDDVVEQMTSVARWLVSTGVERGDRVAVWAPNTASYVPAALGIQAAGAWLVPINTRFRGDEAAYILRKTGAVALFTVDRFLGADYVRLLRRADASLLCLEHLVDLPGPGVASTPGWREVLAAGARVPRSEVEDRISALGYDDVCDVIFTSGTTGQPKGVMLRHGPSLDYFGGPYADAYGLDETSRQIVITPFFHCFGYKAGWMIGLKRGAVTHPLSVFDPVEAMRLVSERRVTHLPGSPTMFSAILDHPARGSYRLASLESSMVGASVIPAPLVHRVRDELGVERTLTGYGLTENHALCAVSRPDDTVEQVTTTAGRLLDDVLCRVVDEAGDEVAPGSEGELLISGPMVMSGYFDEPEATAATVVDGWLHTGDVGRVSPDGYVTITDRKKDIFIMGGFNVSPAEVEHALTAAPGVAQVAVIGTPDDRFGEVGAAFVIPAPGASPTAGSVIAYAREHLANYKVPRRVRIVDELPLNATGKVLKHELRAQFRARSDPSTTTPRENVDMSNESPDTDRIKRELRETYEARFGPPRTELIEAGRVRDYLLAMDEPHDRSEDDPVPPLFLLTLARTRRPQPSRGSAVNAGDDYELRRPVHVGDRITVARQVTDVEEKTGRHGPMYLVRSESTYTNQSGEVVAVSRQSTMRWGL